MLDRTIDLGQLVCFLVRDNLDRLREKVVKDADELPVLDFQFSYGHSSVLLEAYDKIQCFLELKLCLVDSEFPEGRCAQLARF